MDRYGPWMDTNLVVPLGPRKCKVVFDYFLEDHLMVIEKTSIPTHCWSVHVVLGSLYLLLQDDEEFVERSLEDSEKVQVIEEIEFTVYIYSNECSDKRHNNADGRCDALWGRAERPGVTRLHLRTVCSIGRDSDAPFPSTSPSGSRLKHQMYNTNPTPQHINKHFFFYNVLKRTELRKEERVDVKKSFTIQNILDLART